MTAPTINRATAGAAAGFLGALSQYMIVPPTVMQELLHALGWTVSVDLAGFIGTVIVGVLGWAAAEFQGSRTGIEPSPRGELSL